MKKYLVTIALTCSMLLAQNEKDLGDIVEDGLDDILNGIYSSLFPDLVKENITNIEACFPDINLDTSNIDVCSYASKLDNFKVDICSFFGGSGGTVKINTGISQLCKNTQKTFENIVSNQVSSIVEYAGLDNEENTQKLPNGETLNEFYSKWNLNNIISSNGDVAKYLKDAKLDEVLLFMEYSKSNGAKKDISKIEIKDIKAPQTMQEYRNNINESVKVAKNLYKETNPTEIASLAKTKMTSSKSKNSQVGKDIVKNTDELYNKAKNIEIGNALALMDKEMPIPTQEYVEIFRYDLQPKLVSKIRKQQIQEISTINKIEEKYERKKALGKLLIDKEIIMAQEFDREKAQQEIEEIIASVGNDENGSGLPNIPLP